jgi:hypothetical protein
LKNRGSFKVKKKIAGDGSNEQEEEAELKTPNCRHKTLFRKKII